VLLVFAASVRRIFFSASPWPFPVSTWCISVCFWLGWDCFCGGFTIRWCSSALNPSLAHARGISVRLAQYLFIVLLAFVVNYCVKVVGALLINAMLIFPAATSLNLARNLRQYFWIAIGVALLAGPGGTWLSYTLVLEIGQVRLALGSGGIMVVVGVVLFFTSMLIGKWLRGPRPVVPLTH
jgi:ABC-type Mn2+/Zn2+ transport system permease subunit